MKKAHVRLSLRKLFIAMLAAGPTAILPSQLSAVVPQGATAPFVVTNGTATWNGAGTVGTVSSSDRAVLVWNNGAFTIASGETFSFQVPNGSVLNKVGFTTTGAIGTPDTATINGNLTSSGRVIILANGQILVGAGAAINTQGGLYLSTLAETNDFAFTTSGNLSYTGAPMGNATILPNITLGNATGGVSVTNGSLGAFGSLVAVNNITVQGDLIVDQRSAGSALQLGTNGPVTVGNNLTVTTASGALTQVGAVTAPGTTNLTVGANTITLANASNNFGTVMVNATGTTAALATPVVTLRDVDSIVLGTSNVGVNTNGAGVIAAGAAQSLVVTAGGNVSTAGTITVAGGVSLTAAGDIT
jgi:hypothetical protein